MERNVMGELNVYRGSGAKPNFSEIARRHGMDRHTVAKYWRDGESAADGRSARGSAFDPLEEVIRAKAQLPGMTKMAVYGLATLMWTVPGGAQETGGPYMRDPRHPRHFTDEFKRQIVDLYNAGKPKREIMDEYDLGKSTVERWIKSINATGSPRAACNRTPEQNRILELERENRRLRMEVDVLKQAALIYARK